MKILLSRALLHCGIFIVIVSSLFLSCDVESYVFHSAITISAIVASINLLGEIAYIFIPTYEAKAKILKTLFITSVEFLGYLVLAIPFVLCAQSDEKILGLYILGMFCFYALVGFLFFRKQ